MARNIKLTDIAGLMREEIQEVVKLTALEWTKEVKEQTPVFSLDNYSAAELAAMPSFFRDSLLERGTGGRLREAWQTNIGKLRATIANNMKYAEPVLYGKNLPPSWGGQYRTRQNTIPGFPDLIGKEIATNRVPLFIARFRRRN